MSVKVIVTVTILDSLEGIATIILYLVRSFVMDKLYIVIRIAIALAVSQYIVIRKRWRYPCLHGVGM